jgi:hypothetical protein
MTSVALALAVAASALVNSPTTAHSVAASEVNSIIKRTQTTQATYGLVSTNEIRRDDRTIHEFAAEYNQGDLHRVETPRDRIVSNCRTGWSAHLDIATGLVTLSDGIAAVACGIWTGDVVHSAEMTGTRPSEFGSLQLLKITTYASARTYEVAPNGAIVGETITDQNGKLRLITRAISLSEQLPPGDIFSEASLARSVVPDELKMKASVPLN